MEKSEKPDHLPDRRKALLLGAASALTLAGIGTKWSAAAFAQKTDSRIFTPEETEGPYWVDEKLNRSDLRLDPADKTLQKGLPLTLQIKVSALQNGVIAPLSGAYVDLWHCNAVGVYSDVPMQNTVGRKFLRGYQVTDGQGKVQFTTIYPGWYQGRTAHIHFKIRTYSASSQVTHEFTSQLFFSDTLSDTVFANAPYNTRGTRQVRNANDSVFTATETDGTTVGSHLTLSLTQVSGSGYTGTFNIGLSFREFAKKENRRAEVTCSPIIVNKLI